MNINDAFPSSHLKASDLQCRAHTMTMAEVHMERFDEGEKPVLSFSGTHRTLVLNRTNARSISDLHGPETSDWRGRQIGAGLEEVEEGKRSACDGR